jgi:hypothetical protein
MSDTQKVSFIPADSPFVCLTEKQLETLITAQEKYTEYFQFDGCETDITDAIIYDAQTFLPAEYAENIRSFILFNCWHVEPKKSPIMQALIKQIKEEF